MDAEYSPIKPVPFQRQICEKYEKIYWDAASIVPESAFLHPFYFWLARDYCRTQCLQAGDWLLLSSREKDLIWHYLPFHAEGKHQPLLERFLHQKTVISYIPENLFREEELQRYGYTFQWNDGLEYVYAASTLKSMDFSENRRRNVKKFYKTHSDIQFSEERPGFHLADYERVFSRWFEVRGSTHQGNEYFDYISSVRSGLWQIEVGDFGSRLFGMRVGGKLVSYLLGMPLRAERPTFCALAAYYDPDYSDANAVALIELAKLLQGECEYINFTANLSSGLDNFKRTLNPSHLIRCRELVPLPD